MGGGSPKEKRGSRCGRSHTYVCRRGREGASGMGQDRTGVLSHLRDSGGWIFFARVRVGMGRGVVSLPPPFPSPPQGSARCSVQQPFSSGEMTWRRQDPPPPLLPRVVKKRVSVSSAPEKKNREGGSLTAQHDAKHDAQPAKSGPANNMA